jgi:hypothetical protein
MVIIRMNYGLEKIVMIDPYVTLRIGAKLVNKKVFNKLATVTKRNRS